MEKNIDKSDGDYIETLNDIQEALINLYLNVKVRSKEEISKYSEDDLAKERENLYLTSPIDLVNYIQTSVEILMNIKVEDYLVHQKEQQRKDKLKNRKHKGINNNHILEFNEWAKIKETSKKLDDSDFKCSLDGYLPSSKHFSKDSKHGGEAEIKELYENPEILISDRTSSPGVKEGATESYIPFSQRTSLTHAPTLYEELIQKYEGDIRNHIRIEQQMKLHSDSVINKLEDKEKQYDKVHDKLKSLKTESEHLKIELKIIREENTNLKNALEGKIEKILNVERDLKESIEKYDNLKKEFLNLK